MASSDTKRRSPPPCPTGWMFDLNRNAVSVVWALLEIRLSKGNPTRFGVTRKTIADICKLSKRCISKAMSALKKGMWIDLTYGRDGARSWYMVAISERIIDRFTVCRKTTPSKSKVDAKNVPQWTPHCVPKNDPLSLRDKGASSAVPLGDDGSALRVHLDEYPPRPDPADAKMAALRKKRA